MGGIALSNYRTSLLDLEPTPILLRSGSLSSQAATAIAPHVVQPTTFSVPSPNPSYVTQTTPPGWWYNSVTQREVQGNSGTPPDKMPGWTWSPTQRSSISTPSVPSTQDTSSGGILGNLKRIGTDLLNTAKTTVTATVRGALEGGRAASSGAASGAQVGAASVSIDTTKLLFLGVGVLALVLLLRRR